MTAIPGRPGGTAVPRLQRAAIFRLGVGLGLSGGTTVGVPSAPQWWVEAWGWEEGMVAGSGGVLRVRSRQASKASTMAGRRILR